MALKPLGRVGTEAAKGNRQGIGKGGRQAGAIRSKEMILGNVVPNSHNSCAPSLNGREGKAVKRWQGSMGWH